MDHNVAVTVIGLFIFVGAALWPSIGSRDSVEKFILGNRSIGTLPGIWTILASKVGGGFLVSVSVIAALYGWHAMFFFAGYILGYILFAWRAAQVYDFAKNERLTTLADLFLSGNDKSKLYWIVKFLSVLTMFGWVLTNLVAGATMLGELASISYELCAILILVTVLFYLIVAGYPAVVRSDVIQISALVVIMISVVFALFKGVSSLSDVSAFKQLFVSTESLPVGRIIAFLILGIVFPIGSYDLYQRMYSSTDKRAFTRSSIVSGFVFTIVGILIITITLFYKAQVSELSPDIGIESGQLFTIGIGNYLDNYKPIWLIAILAAIFSSLDTFLFACASALFLNKGEQGPSTIYNLRFGLVGIAILAFLVTLILRDISKITLGFAAITVILGFIAFIRIGKLNSTD